MGLAYAVIICAFSASEFYECDQGMLFNNQDECEEYAYEVDQAKSLSAYCTVVDPVELSVQDEV